jgi:hypothetical protein
MVLGIAGLGEATSLRRKRGAVGAVHAASGALGGAAMTASLWLALTPLRTLLPGAVPTAVLACVATAAALADVRVIDLPRQRRQVPQIWFRSHGPFRSYALYGLWLGAGLITNITYMVELVVLVAAALLLPAPDALLVGAVFGLGRTAPVGPLGSSRRLAAWWGSVVYGGETTSAVRMSAALSASVAVVAAARVIGVSG